MQFRIHHGANQIGGNCVELEADGSTLLLDLGLPIDGEAVVPDVAGLHSAKPGFLGVVLSHAHLDHYGLLPRVRPDLPVWLGEGAIRLLAAASPFSTQSALLQAMIGYRDREPFHVGPFRITPYVMDHSAFDAYALLVEAGGKRLFYSGDFRGHGRKGRLLDRLVSRPPASIDVLIMEGTTFGRTSEHVTETDVEVQALDLMGKHAGLVLLTFSGQNIDRFVSFLRASMRANRTLIVDPYMAAVIGAAQMRGLPDVLCHPGIRVYLPLSQKRMIVRSGRFDLIEPFRPKRIFLDAVAQTPGRYALMFRSSMRSDINDVDLTDGALIYSLWPGYLERSDADLRGWAGNRGVSFYVVHSSGHAIEADLRRLVHALSPARLVPIHTSNPLAFKRLHDHVVFANSGVWFMT